MAVSIRFQARAASSTVELHREFCQTRLLFSLPASAQDGCVYSVQCTTYVSYVCKERWQCKVLGGGETGRSSSVEIWDAEVGSWRTGPELRPGHVIRSAMGLKVGSPGKEQGFPDLLFFGVSLSLSAALFSHSFACKGAPIWCKCRVA